MESLVHVPWNIQTGTSFNVRAQSVLGAQAQTGATAAKRSGCLYAQYRAFRPPHTHARQKDPLRINSIVRDTIVEQRNEQVCIRSELASGTLGRQNDERSGVSRLLPAALY
jgi:hypothetical protein